MMQNNKSSRKICEGKSERSRNEIDSSICAQVVEFLLSYLNLYTKRFRGGGGGGGKKFDWPTIYDIDVEKIKWVT